MENLIYNGKRNFIALVTIAVVAALGANHAQAVRTSHAKVPVVEVVELI
jgi:hypothetical protein